MPATKADPVAAACERFYVVHRESLFIDKGQGLVPRTIAELGPSEWPPRPWWLSIESLCDQLLAIKQLPAWKLTAANLLIRRTIEWGLQNQKAGEVSIIVDQLSQARDGSDYVRHEPVAELHELTKVMGGSEEFLMKMRGCTSEQAHKILTLDTSDTEAMDALSAELDRTCVWPHDRQAKEREAKERHILAELKKHWDRRKRFEKSERDEAATSLEALFAN